MIVSFDENVQERDCAVLFEFNSEFDICVTVIEVVQKLGCCVFIVEQGEGIVYVSKPSSDIADIAVAKTLRNPLHPDQCCFI